MTHDPATPPKKRPFWRRVHRRWRGHKRNARRFLVFALTLPVLKFLRLFPPRVARNAGAFLGALAYRLAASERRKILDNLEIAYGDGMTSRERDRLGREIMVNAGRTMGEWAYLEAGRAGKLTDEVEIDGWENVQKVLDEDCGIICLTAHYGNWELMAPMMPKAFPGKEVGVVARDLSNPWINRRTIRSRERSGTRVFPRGSTGRDYIRFLRGKNILAVLGDIDTDKGAGIFVDFFGRSAWTQRGIARLALLGRARILPVFIQRDKTQPDRHVVRVMPPVSDPRHLSEEDYTRVVTQEFTAAIEKAVRDRPDQWMWIHRRWKTRPEDVKAREEAAGASQASAEGSRAFS